ncbi:bifunctional 2',3'-cyclic-nucleotide 2'-phosphodiesterase/3'-nucleotidase [Octadecabacter sp. R77987]|uniref:bifunctional 2',3'-cyclic-nucleotide 2'-phosphodiesterase/3'-nucleotidase n=1 Tax=Octadecabacter sp. R77987 TaxID=3093874 RepID=UPI00366B953A
MTTTTLRILETTDMHVHLLAYDYYTDQPDAGVGLSRTASLIRQMRAEVDNCLLFDNGDYLQGTPLSDFVAHETSLGGTDPHPAIAAMNTLHYDAATLGNHEFNFGLDFLRDTLAQAHFPVTCSNVVRALGDTPEQDETLLPQYLILDRMLTDEAGQDHPIKIGVIGAAPPQILQWDNHHLKGRVTTRDIVATARVLVPQIKEEGADIIVALCHSGIGAQGETNMMENAAVPLAAIDGIDVVLAGHTHLVFPSEQFAKTDAVDPDNGRIHGKPAVMAGFNGSHLGVIDLTLTRNCTGWRIMRDKVRAVPIARRDPQSDTIHGLVPCDDLVREAALAAHSATIAHVRQPIGTTPVPLQSYFAMVANDITVRIVAQAQRNAANAILADSPHAGAPVLSAVAPFKAGARGGPNYFVDIPAGPLQQRNVADLYLYPNTLSLLELTGAQLRLWLERAAGAFARITQGIKDQPLLDPNFPSYNFDVIDGLTYEIDPTAPSRFDAQGVEINPAAQRIHDLRLGGVRVSDDQTNLVITNSYRAGGGGGFQGAMAGKVIASGVTSIRDALLDHLRDGTEPVREPAATWRFRPLPDTIAQFESSPHAQHYLGSVKDRKITHVGPAANGFAQYALRFDAA